jgi:hypothetical protein
MPEELVDIVDDDDNVIDTVTRAEAATWKPGEVLLLNGKILTGRDAAHKPEPHHDRAAQCSTHAPLPPLVARHSRTVAPPVKNRSEAERIIFLVGMRNYLPGRHPWSFWPIRLGIPDFAEYCGAEDFRCDHNVAVAVLIPKAGTIAEQDRFAAIGIPDAHLPIRAARGDRSTLGIKSHAQYLTLMSPQ